MKYIQTLLQEKNISLDTTLLEGDSMFGLTVEMLLDFIYSLPNRVIKQIESTFRQIDFRNGNVMNYVEFLAKGMIKSI